MPSTRRVEGIQVLDVKSVTVTTVESVDVTVVSVDITVESVDVLVIVSVTRNRTLC